MQISRVLFERIAALLAASTDVLNHLSAFNQYQLLDGDFTPSLDLVHGDLNFALSDLELEQISIAAGVQTWGIDPLTQDLLIRLEIADAQFQWFETTGGGTYPKTYYGMAFVDGNVETLWGTIKFADPIVVDRGDLIIDVPDWGFRFPAAMIR